MAHEKLITPANLILIGFEKVNDVYERGGTEIYFDPGTRALKFRANESFGTIGKEIYKKLNPNSN